MSAIIWLKRIFYVLLVLLLLLCGYWLGAENSQPVTVTLFGLMLPESALGAVLCAALLVGAVVGCLVSLVPIVRLTNSLLSLKRKLKRRDTELAKLRTAPLKD